MQDSAEENHPSEITVETSMGYFTVELYYRHAPETCKNFARLSLLGYYNNVIFHRIIKDFIVQGGDQTGTGKGRDPGLKLPNELNKELKHTGAGILSMADAAPNASTNQFLITLAPCPSLDGKHVIFGRVSKGMEIIKKLGSIQTDNNDRPVHDVKIIKATVTG